MGFRDELNPIAREPVSIRDAFTRRENEPGRWSPLVARVESTGHCELLLESTLSLSLSHPFLLSLSCSLIHSLVLSSPVSLSTMVLFITGFTDAQVARLNVHAGVKGTSRGSLYVSRFGLRRNCALRMGCLYLSLPVSLSVSPFLSKWTLVIMINLWIVFGAKPRGSAIMFLENNIRRDNNTRKQCTILSIRDIVTT